MVVAVVVVALIELTAAPAVVVVPEMKRRLRSLLRMPLRRVRRLDSAGEHEGASVCERAGGCSAVRPTSGCAPSASVLGSSCGSVCERVSFIMM